MGHAGMLTKRPFVFHVVGRHLAFDDDLGIRRHHDVDGLAAHHVGRLLQQGAGNIDLIGFVTGRPGRRDIIGRVMADHGGHRHRLALFPILLHADIGVALGVNEDAHLPRPFDVIALQGDILRAGLRILDELHRRADERHTAVAVGMNVNRNPPQVGVVAFPDDFFYRPVFDDLRFDQTFSNASAQLRQRFVLGRAQTERHLFPAAAHVTDRGPVGIALEIVEHGRLALLVLAAISEAGQVGQRVDFLFNIEQQFALAN